MGCMCAHFIYILRPGQSTISMIFLSERRRNLATLFTRVRLTDADNRTTTGVSGVRTPPLFESPGSDRPSVFGPNHFSSERREDRERRGQIGEKWDPTTFKPKLRP